jgi:hypothetical protein
MSRTPAHDESREQRLANMASLGLGEGRYERWKALIRAVQHRWPPALLEYCRAQASRLGYSGGALGEWVADWLLSQPDAQDDAPPTPPPEPDVFIIPVETPR